MLGKFKGIRSYPELCYRSWLRTKLTVFTNYMGVKLMGLVLNDSKACLSTTQLVHHLLIELCFHLGERRKLTLGGDLLTQVLAGPFDRLSISSVTQTITCLINYFADSKPITNIPSDARTSKEYPM
jgi:hypothetical protein